MPTILITGHPRSGKTSLAAGLLAIARGAGRSAAYAKPFSAGGGSDPDVSFASQILAGGLGIHVAPASPTAGDATAAAAEITALQASCEVVVVETPDDARANDLAGAADARVIAVQAYDAGLDWADVLDAAAVSWGTHLANVLANAVPPYRRSDVAAGAAQSSADVEAVLIPESREMLAPTVAQVAAHLGATWVQDPPNTDAPVERFLIGGNIMDNGPTYYGRYANQAVITRAQRPDIQLACMLPQTRCLVLTGPGEATNYIRAEALERDIPLMQAPTSTIETAEALDRLIDTTTTYSLSKARIFAGMLQECIPPEILTEWLA